MGQFVAARGSWRPMGQFVAAREQETSGVICRCEEQETSGVVCGHVGTNYPRGL